MATADVLEVMTRHLNQAFRQTIIEIMPEGKEREDKLVEMEALMLKTPVTAGTALPDPVALVRARLAGTRPVDKERAPLLPKVTEYLKQRIIACDEKNCWYFEVDRPALWKVAGVEGDAALRLVPWETVLVPHMRAELKAASKHYTLEQHPHKNYTATIGWASVAAAALQ